MNMNSLQKDTIKLLPQERNGKFRFNGRLVMTTGFAHEFGDFLAPQLAVMAVMKIRSERVNSKNGADYLQVLEYGGVRFWVIDDVDYVTVLMPSDY